MGYTIHNCTIRVVDSDAAADAVADIERGIIKHLREIMKVKENSVNTDGIINAAAIVCDCFSQGPYWGRNAFYLHDFIEKTLLPRLKKYILEQENVSVEEWNGEKNKSEHIRAYRKLLRKLVSLMEAF